MAEAQKNDADAVFNELDTVAGAIKRLRLSAPWKADMGRLYNAYQDVTAALAQAAYAEFPDDERRWSAGDELMTLTGAFRDPTSGVAPDAWRALTLQVEADIIGAPEAPDVVLSTAFRHFLTRTIEQPKAAADVPTMLDAYDGLTAQIAACLPGAALVEQAPYMLITKLEKLDARAELRARLGSLATSGDDRMRIHATGRLRVLDARETPLELALENIAGEPMSLEALRGEVVLLQFWASWCPPCRAEIPHLRAAHAAYRSRGFRIIGLSLDRTDKDESPDQARARVVGFMQDNGMDWATQFDGSMWDNPYVSLFGISSIPASLLLDRNGRVAMIDPRGEDIAVQVERLLA